MRIRISFLPKRPESSLEIDMPMFEGCVSLVREGDGECYEVEAVMTLWMRCTVNSDC